MTTRRDFLKGLLGSAVVVAAPAICKSENLMKIWVPAKEIIIPTGFIEIPAYWETDYWNSDGFHHYNERLSEQYNRLAIRQDEFGETFFPTIALSGSFCK